MKLVLPAVEYKTAYLEALEDSKDETSDTLLNQPRDGQSFEEFVQEWLNQSKGLDLSSGFVPATMFWLLDDNEIIGRVHIRHELNDYLLRQGGHIGYYIRPSKRKMGYGKKILELGLVEAKRLGLAKVLITCDEDNLASAKIIEANGGVLENLVDNDSGKPRTKRYWIEIAS